MAEPTLIDKYLPDYTFHEYHCIEVNRPIAEVYESARDFDMSKSRLIKALFFIRGLPTKRMNLQGFISEMGFTLIEERFPTENLMGFWARTKIEPIASHDDFIDNTISAMIKVVWNFRCNPINDHQTQLSTETRVRCMSPLTKLTFGLYWTIIRPFSGAIRKRMLRIIKNDAESNLTAAPGENMTGNRLVLDFGAFMLDATLFDSPVAKRFFDNLPFTVDLQQWGDELYGSIGIDLGEERPVPDIPSGGIAYTNNGNYVCFFFGQTPAWPVEYIGRINGDGWKKLADDAAIRSVTIRRPAP